MIFEIIVFLIVSYFSFMFGFVVGRHQGHIDGWRDRKEKDETL